MVILWVLRLDPAKLFCFCMMNLGSSPEPKITSEKAEGFTQGSFAWNFLAGGKPWNDSVLVVLQKKCDVQTGGHTATSVDTCNGSKGCARKRCFTCEKSWPKTLISLLLGSMTTMWYTKMVTNALPWTDIAQPISMKIILLDLPIEDATS